MVLQATDSTSHNISTLLNSIENYGLLLEPVEVSKQNISKILYSCMSKFCYYRYHIFPIVFSVHQFHSNVTSFTSSDRFTISLQNTVKNSSLVEIPAVIHMPKIALLDSES